MPKASPERLHPIGDYWISKHPQRPDGEWCRTWYDRSGRQTRRNSLGTCDLQESKGKLEQWYASHLLGLDRDQGKHDRSRPAAIGAQPPELVSIENLMVVYWEQHAKSLQSAATEFRNLGCWQEFWEGRTVAEITPTEQARFRDWLVSRPRGGRTAAKPLTGAGIDRILDTGRAALERAVKYQLLTAAPHVFSTMTADAKRSRKPKGRPITLDELASLFRAAQSFHARQYLVFACATMARPGAILDIRSGGYDAAHQILSINPAGRAQNKKFRPMIPVAPTLRPWLALPTGESGVYVTYRGQPVANILATWRLMRARAGLDIEVTPYSIRHTMSRELRKRRVPTEQISLFLGHLPSGSTATTSIYAPYEPDFLSDAIAGVEVVFGTIAQLLPDGYLSPPSVDYVPTGQASRRGIGEEKRESIRRMMIDGVPHARIVTASGVSGATISAIRKELKRHIDLPRATGCVTIALSNKSANGNR